MNRILTVGIPGLALLCVGMALAPRHGRAAARVFAHDVYFTLHESTPEARQALVDACHEYLSGHDGTLLFAAGTRAREMKRDVNDTAFDVSLHVHFEDEAAHAAYQEHPRHQEFIARMNANWKTVRVFDSWVSTVP